jgi:hypothetical protein
MRFSPEEILGLLSPGGREAGERRARDIRPGGPAARWDFSRPRSLAELAGLFEEPDPARLEAALERLTKIGAVAPPAASRGERLYEPLAAFYLGFEHGGRRGAEFRAWFGAAMRRFFFERADLLKEALALAEENKAMKKELALSESFKEKIKREYQKLKKLSAEREEEALSRCEGLAASLKACREARARDGLRITSLYQEVVRLENDVQSAEEWHYPLTLPQTLRAASRLYRSRLILPAGRKPEEISSMRPTDHGPSIAEAVRMIKALALTLHPMKYKYGNFRRERFEEETGMEMIKRPGRAGSEHCLSSSPEGFSLRIYFAFLEEERKIQILGLSGEVKAGGLRLVPPAG